MQPEVLRRRGTTEGVGSGTAAKGNGKGIKKGPGQGEGAVKMKWLLVPGESAAELFQFITPPNRDAYDSTGGLLEKVL